jgi:hypothetical protein
MSSIKYTGVKDYKDRLWIPKPDGRYTYTKERAIGWFQFSYTLTYPSLEKLEAKHGPLATVYNVI